MSLVGRAKNWLLTFPNGIIQTWDELEEKFSKMFFPLAKFMENRADNINFEQGNAKSLYDTCERLRGDVESFAHLYGEACRNHQLND